MIFNGVRSLTDLCRCFAVFTVALIEPKILGTQFLAQGFFNGGKMQEAEQSMEKKWLHSLHLQPVEAESPVCVVTTVSARELALSVFTCKISL